MAKKPGKRIMFPLLFFYKKGSLHHFSNYQISVLIIFSKLKIYQIKAHSVSNAVFPKKICQFVQNELTMNIVKYTLL